MAQPPSFYSGAPRVAPMPLLDNPSAPLARGIGALAAGAEHAADSMARTDDQLADYNMQTERVRRERDLQAHTADRAAALATEYGALQEDLLRMRAEAGPGAVGYEEKVATRIGTFRDDFLTSLGNDDELVNRFSDNVAAMAASARVGEVRFAIEARAGKSVNDGETLRDTLANNVRSKVVQGGGDDPLLVTNAKKLWDTYVESTPIPGNAREKLRADGYQRISLSASEGLLEVNPQLLMDTIDKGTLDAELPPPVIRQLRDRAQAEVERAARAAKSAAGEGDQVRRAQGRVMVEQVGEGVEIDTPALQSALTAAQASKDPEDINLAHDLTVALTKNATTIAYGKVSNAERLAGQRDIEATKDWQKDEKLVAAHSQLATLIARDTRAAKEDPLGLYARQTGTALPAVEVGDRNAMVQRFALGDRVAQRYAGTPPTHLTEPEAVQLRQTWNSGNPSSRADFILTVGQYGPQRGRELMRQLAPNKPELARLVELSAFRDPALKALVREALDGEAQPESKAVNSNAMQARLRSDFGDMLAMMPGDRRQAVQTVATWIYKHRAAQAGKGAFDGQLWTDSVTAALGGGPAGGGVGKARGGQRFVLPVSMPQDNFDAIMATSAPRDFRASSNGVPRWNGRDMTEGEFKRLTPVLVSDSGAQALYAFRSGSGFAKTEAGDNYILDVRRLAAVRRARR